MKSCLKKPPQTPSCCKRPSLREIVRRASSRRGSIHEVLKTQTETTTESILSDSCSSSRRTSESIRTLFARLHGSSRRVFVEQERERKSLIQFGNVYIREYEVTAGHHPGGRSGVPIEVSILSGLNFSCFNMEFISMHKYLLSLSKARLELQQTRPSTNRRVRIPSFH